MKVRVVLYFLVPILVYVIQHMTSGDRFQLYMLLANYVYYAAPLAIWVVAARVSRMGTGYLELGLAILCGYLISFAVLFYCCIPNNLGMNWIYYQATAIVTAFVIWVYWRLTKNGDECG